MNTTTASNGDGRHHGLNGMKIPLVVNGATILAGIVSISILYAQVQQLREDRVSDAQRAASATRAMERLAQVEAQAMENRRTHERDQARTEQRLDRLEERGR